MTLALTLDIAEQFENIYWDVLPMYFPMWRGKIMKRLSHPSMKTTATKRKKKNRPVSVIAGFYLSIFCTISSFIASRSSRKLVKMVIIVFTCSFLCLNFVLESNKSRE